MLGVQFIIHWAQEKVWLDGGPQVASQKFLVWAVRRPKLGVSSFGAGAFGGLL